MKLRKNNNLLAFNWWTEQNHHQHTANNP